jgi:hypothetical protein
LVAGKPFRCRKCGGVKLEEVVTNCTQSVAIASVGEEAVATGEAEYDGIAETDGGELDRIQCLACGHVVARCYTQLLEAARKWPNSKRKSK